jgi:transposase
MAGQYFHILSNSLFTVRRQHSRDFSVRVASSRDTIYRIVKQFEERGSESDKRAKGRKRVPSVRVEDAVSVAREAITVSPRKNVRHLAKQTGISTSTA